MCRIRFTWICCLGRYINAARYTPTARLSPRVHINSEMHRERCRFIQTNNHICGNVWDAVKHRESLESNTQRWKPIIWMGKSLRQAWFIRHIMPTAVIQTGNIWITFVPGPPGLQAGAYTANANTKSNAQGCLTKPLHPGGKRSFHSFIERNQNPEFHSGFTAVAMTLE